MMLFEMKALINNKVALLVILLTLIWCVVDSRTRLLINSNNTQIKNTGFKAVPLTLPQPSKQLVAKLNVAYQKYHQKINQDTDKEQGLSLAEQAKQHGEVKKLFIGDNRVELKAVISVANKTKNSIQAASLKSNTPQVSALLAITNIKTGKQHIEKISNHADFYGFLLTIKNNTQVVLTKKITNNQQDSRQKIVLIMYKPSSK